MATSRFEEDVERAMGETIGSIRDMPLSERQRKLEETTGKPLEVVTYHPLIGRGTVLGDRGVTHRDVEAAYGEAIRPTWYERIRWLWSHIGRRST